MNNLLNCPSQKITKLGYYLYGFDPYSSVIKKVTLKHRIQVELSTKGEHFLTFLRNFIRDNMVRHGHNPFPLNPPEMSRNVNDVDLVFFLRHFMRSRR